MSCIYCVSDHSDTFAVATWRICEDCSQKTYRQRIENRLSMWQQGYPPGSDFTGEGHLAPPAWTYDFWRECNFSDEQLPKVEPSLGFNTLHMEWHTYEGQLISRVERHKFDSDENADHPLRWDYSLEFGDEDGEIKDRCVYFWRCNTIGIPMAHWEPQEGGRHVHDGVPGEYVDHPQPSWAVLDGFLLTNPTVDQIHHYVDTGELPLAQDGQQVIT